MKESLNRFKGKTALVTGAGSGIGRAIALRIAEEGADISLFDVNKESLEETEKMIKGTGQKVLSKICDVGVMKEIEECMAQFFKTFNKIDILVNCAGIGDTNAMFDEVDPELWDRVYAVNVKGPFFLSKSAASNMIENKTMGRIINIASVEGKTNRGGSLAYASSKSALIGLTQGLAMQLAPYDITVNSVCPGLIDTPIWHRGDKSMDMPEGSTIKMVSEIAIDSRQLKIMRVGLPEEIAGSVAFLASEDATYMTGQAINVCGGLESH